MIQFSILRARAFMHVHVCARIVCVCNAGSTLQLLTIEQIHKFLTGDYASSR